jgi:putative ABC transport system ATP-binding protein
MAIVVKDLNKIFSIGSTEIHAIRGLNLTVKEGEMIALVGPSGSGKTTLLNIIGGLDKATAGSVNVLGMEITSNEPEDLVDYRRKTVGHIFQTLNLIPTLTAAENVELPMVALGASRDEKASRVKELIEVVGLGDRMNHKPTELSGGEQQRVAIAAALANDPPMILADEPTGELDTVTAKIIVDYLREVNKELGKTIIMVSHDPNAARAADRILNIRDGVIHTDVEPTETHEEGAASYADMLKLRLSEIDSQVSALEAEFREHQLTSEEFLREQNRLNQTRSVLQGELQRLGIVV